MKKLSLLFIFCIVLTSACFAQNKDRRASYKSWENYEISIERVGVEGTKFVKVWGYGKSVDKAIMNAKKNAVHACIFRGLPGNTNANYTPAILNDAAYIEHYDYFEQFFAPGGAYLGFVNVTTDGIPSGQDRRKVKGGYKVALYVQVMYDNLKTKLVNDGLKRRLSDGF
ncbi:MAG: hypothetical protein J6V55_03975 [Alistipes sp.]|nr:hypothetical protein [Alistipes sp.]